MGKLRVFEINATIAYIETKIKQKIEREKKEILKDDEKRNIFLQEEFGDYNNFLNKINIIFNLKKEISEKQNYLESLYKEIQLSKIGKKITLYNLRNSMELSGENFINSLIENRLLVKIGKEINVNKEEIKNQIIIKSSSNDLDKIIEEILNEYKIN